MPDAAQQRGRQPQSDPPSHVTAAGSPHGLLAAPAPCPHLPASPQSVGLPPHGAASWPRPGAAAEEGTKQRERGTGRAQAQELGPETPTPPPPAGATPPAVLSSDPRELPLPAAAHNSRTSSSSRRVSRAPPAPLQTPPHLATQLPNAHGPPPRPGHTGGKGAPPVGAGGPGGRDGEYGPGASGSRGRTVGSPVCRWELLRGQKGSVLAAQGT